MVMEPNSISRNTSLQREIAERLSSFFVSAADGRSTSLDAGAALATTQGAHRDRNEDRSAVVRFRFGSMRPNLRLAILCDGMGGMAKGGEAASLAMGAFIAAFATIHPDCPLPDRLDGACKFANVAVFNEYGGNAGTTLTAIALGVNTRWAVHVGDSRLYGIDDSRQTDLVTQDDTVSGAVNAHLGQNDEDNMDNRLLQFIGIGDALDPHLTDVSGDNNHGLWLLTSDGAHSVGRKVLGGVCEGSRSPLDLVRKLVFVSEAMNTQDNATAICIRSGHVEPIEQEHEGLTIQLTAPDRNLDIWLPPSIVEMRPAVGAMPEQTQQPANNFVDHGDRLPRAAQTRKPRSNRTKGAPRKQIKKPIDSELPLGVVFEIDGTDD